MIERRPMELFYTVGDFGPVVDLGDRVRPDYRISLTALNDFLDRHEFSATAPIYARNIGELRRKAGAKPRNGGEFAPLPVNSTSSTS